MIATVEEFDEAKALVERELTHLRRHGHKLPDGSRSAPWSRCPRCSTSSTNCSTHVDFLSVGSNDLMQFLYAADRGNPRVAEPLRSALGAGPARAQGHRRQGRAHGKPVTLCGELASQPLGALALVAIGYRSLSLTPSAIGPVKAMLLDLDSRKAAAFLVPLMESRLPAASRSASSWRASPPTAACRFRV